MKKTKVITVEHAKTLVKSTQGAIFAASFLKADGSLRRLNGRLGVVKGLTGRGMSYSPSAYNLLPVWDIKAAGYRMLNFNTLISLTVDGELFQVIQ